VEEFPDVPSLAVSSEDGKAPTRLGMFSLRIGSFPRMCTDILENAGATSFVAGSSCDCANNWKLRRQIFRLIQKSADRDFGRHSTICCLYERPNHALQRTGFPFSALSFGFIDRFLSAQPGAYSPSLSFCR
jgi:hypothetical protein